jgi:hypothetical protein
MSQKEMNQRKSKDQDDISRSGKNNYMDENGNTNEKEKKRKKTKLQKRI